MGLFPLSTLEYVRSLGAELMAMKVMVQRSFGIELWSRRRDLNPGPPPYQGGALPAELRRRKLHKSPRIRQDLRVFLWMPVLFEGPNISRRLFRATWRTITTINLCGSETLDRKHSVSNHVFLYLLGLSGMLMLYVCLNRISPLSYRALYCALFL